MAFKRLTPMDIYDVIRRWHSKQKISYISKVTGYDRKTVRRYVNAARSLGLCEDKDLPDKDAVISLLRDVVGDRTYIQPAREILFPYRDEIIQLVEESEYKLRPKIAFEVICTRHDLYKSVSYSSFKRFYRIRCLNELSVKTTCRIETPPHIQQDFLICFAFPDLYNFIDRPDRSPPAAQDLGPDTVPLQH